MYHGGEGLEARLLANCVATAGMLAAMSLMLWGLTTEGRIRTPRIDGLSCRVRRRLRAAPAGDRATTETSSARRPSRSGTRYQRGRDDRARLTP